MQIFSTPCSHPKSKPFVDHILSFSIEDNRIWFRNFQVNTSNLFHTAYQVHEESATMVIGGSSVMAKFGFTVFFTSFIIKIGFWRRLVKRLSFWRQKAIRDLIYLNFVFQIVEEDGSLLEIGMFCSYFHCLVPISDWHLISPYNIRRLSSNKWWELRQSSAS